MAKNNISELLQYLRKLIKSARTTTARSIDFIHVWTNFQIGRAIVENEQHGHSKAVYAERTILTISKKLTSEFGRGFSDRNLRLMRTFFLYYKNHPIWKSVISKSPVTRKKTLKLQSVISKSKGSNIIPIFKPLVDESKLAEVFKLSWTQYIFLMSIDDPDERSFYEIESINQNWSVRELKRNFNSSLYERLILSKNKKRVKEISKKGQIIENPEDTIKDPYVLEFLGLDEKTSYSETELETAIINRIETFLLELGKGFLFETRQKRITIKEKHYSVDLVFYNRLLRCYVLIDLKIGELTHKDIGQMQMYVNYFDRKKKLKEENPTVGILLCKHKDDALVEMTLPKDNKQIFASRYNLYLPSKAQLKRQIKQINID